MKFKDLKMQEKFTYFGSLYVKLTNFNPFSEYNCVTTYPDYSLEYVRDETEVNKDLPLFVYGTLKRGQCNNSIAGTYIKTTTLHNHIMFDLGCPVVIPKEGYKVIGELFYLEDFSITDRLEQHPDLYKRTIVETEDGPAWCYIFQNTDDDVLLGRNVIEWW